MQEGDAEPAADAPLKPSEEHVRVMESIALAFAALAGLSPLMLVLDDMHWADSDTIEALGHTATHLENRRALLVISYRSAEARERPEMWKLIRSLDQRPSCSRVVLQGCSLSQTGDLVRSCLGQSDPDLELIRRVFESTGGLPLLVVELLRSAHEPARAGDENNDMSPPASEHTTALAPRLRDLIGSRIQDLQEDARLVLELLAVHNGDLSLRELEAAGGLSDSSVLRAIDSLFQRRLVVVHPDAYRLAHGLLRRVVYDAMPPSVQADLHGRLGAVVQTYHPEEVEVLAHHFQMAQLPERAAYYLEQSAVRAMAVSAYNSAARYLAQAAGALKRPTLPPDNGSEWLPFARRCSTSSPAEPNRKRL